MPTPPAAQPRQIPTDVTLPLPGADPYAWLEDVGGDAALAWARERGEAANARLAGGGLLAEIEAEVLEVLDDDARIPYVGAAGDHLYNFWRDAEHPRGLWRRTSEESYRTDEPVWEVLLDLDALNEAEGEDWVWHGASLLRPDLDRAIVTLSHGGSDADVDREYDLATLAFVDPANGGFVRPEAKGGLAWIDRDTVFVFSAEDEASSTRSGYPRVVRRWRRGAPMSTAEVVYEGLTDDLYISAHHERTPGFERDVVTRSIAFYDSETYVLDAAGTPVLVPAPRSADVLLHGPWALVRLREPWEVAGTAHPGGTLLAAPLDALLAGAHEPVVLFAPTPTSALENVTWTRSRVVLTVLEDVRHRIEVLTPPDAPSGAWQHAALPGAPAAATLAVGAVDRDTHDDLWITATDFLTPPTLVRVDATAARPSEYLKAAPSFFDASTMRWEQHTAVSDDGTRVPYFVVHGDPAARESDGPVPTLLYGYGGFEISLTADYSGVLGRAWLARGGTYVLANIRGGGEYGPDWHAAALQDKRHRAYEDFAAVARDVVARGITDHAHLACKGGSNGGLLTGNMLASYPELFGAIVVQVPLLDMHRYTRLLAGASWQAEYGDPDDPAQWEFIRTFSPYHLLRPGTEYPPVLLTTSTKDDRVHPGHARKMTALLEALGADVTYYENLEGGHGGAADNSQAAHLAALAYAFCWERLGG
ncbi:prolyl oligopeptidase family serine peptidase [Sanguibacter massiliensis]|uniref:prolyl oligopeptidase family serine peptidase n=1 Tax=Sanguibacter massiliensis TaxID=1973217 RepID=UPI000C81E962|nr:prolyl oligopeptidase family serine peptidase [Sanguibacter massiliensis]